MSKKSKPKKLPDLSKQDILTPIDLTQLGTNGDVCFGIGYDLSTKECKLCGDSELCAFKMSQNLNRRINTRIWMYLKIQLVSRNTSEA